MSIKLGATDVSAVYLGSEAVKIIYLGNEAVWGSTYQTKTVSGSTGSYGIVDEGSSTTMYTYHETVTIGPARNVKIEAKRATKAAVSYDSTTGKASCTLYANAANTLVSAILSYELVIA
jgi:hypothetical protein